MATEDAPPDDPLRADEPRADEPRADEPRAKDLLTRPRAELEQAMDPATLAQLASWFDRPSAIVVAEQEAVDAEELEFREQLARREQASAAVDPALVDAIVRRQDTRRVTVREVVPPQLTVDESILQAFVRRQLDRQSAEEPEPDIRAYGVPHDIDEILAKHNAPQAVLRDLFRPVTDFELHLTPLFEESPPNIGMSEARQAIRERPEPLPWVESPLGEFRRFSTEARAIVRGSWPAHVAAVIAARAAAEAAEGQGR